MEAPQQPRRRGDRTFFALILALGLIGGFAGAALATVVFSDNPSLIPSTTVSSAATGVEDVVDEALPSLVAIINEGRPRRENNQVIQSTSIGSGVLIDARGFLITNEHVVRDAARLTIVMSNGKELRGVVVSDDQPFTDIAVVKVEGGQGPFPTISFGDSEALRLGERLVSIGNSLDLFRGSVTTGVVSGLHREWTRTDGVMEDLIQTDAAVNHGNSGGALINTRGELVGMNTTVIRQGEDGQAVEGIALAISSKTLKDVALPIIQQGIKIRPTLGIEELDVSPDQAVANGLPPVQGAQVQTVAAGSPAQRSGIRPNDIILSMDGKTLTPERPYLNILMRLPIDRSVDVELLRAGARMTVSVTPVARARRT